MQLQLHHLIGPTLQLAYTVTFFTKSNSRGFLAWLIEAHHVGWSHVFAIENLSEHFELQTLPMIG